MFAFLTNIERRLGNIFMWLTLIMGTGMFMSLYSMEWYARINCPSSDVSYWWSSFTFDCVFNHFFLLVFFIQVGFSLGSLAPRSWTCISLNTEWFFIWLFKRKISRFKPFSFYTVVPIYCPFHSILFYSLKCSIAYIMLLTALVLNSLSIISLMSPCLRYLNRIIQSY